MKRKPFIYAMTLLAVVGISMSSCIGSFKLSGKVLSWNEQVSQHKFVNELVFLAFCIVPVYEITLLADAIVLNSIEFWGGTNPVSSNDLEKTIKGEKSEYLVKQKKDGYRIIDNKTGAKVDLVYDQATQSWAVMSKNKPVTFMSFVNENTVSMNLPNGKTMNVELSEAGVTAFKQAMMKNYSEISKN